MKKEDLYETIGEIEEKYIEEAHKTHSKNEGKKKGAWKKYISIASGLAAVLLITIVLSKVVNNTPTDYKSGEAEEQAAPSIEESVMQDEGEAESSVEGEAAGSVGKDTGAEGESMITPGNSYDMVMYGMSDAAKEIYGGRYWDKTGKMYVIITNDSKESRTLICEEIGLNEDNVAFVEGKYTFEYLIKLQAEISNAMAQDKIPFVISTEIKEQGNHILAVVTTEDEEELEKLYELDTIGGAILVEAVAGEETEDVSSETFTATIVEVYDGSVVVEPSEEEAIRKSADKVSFGTADIDESIAQIGNLVEITYTGEIRESYPAQIDVIEWELAEGN